ncbi:hypothetical protein ACFLWR_03445 [Chloroflexota bacterium]
MRRKACVGEDDSSYERIIDRITGTYGSMNVKTPGRDYTQTTKQIITECPSFMGT